MEKVPMGPPPRRKAADVSDDSSAPTASEEHSSMPQSSPSDSSPPEIPPPPPPPPPPPSSSVEDNRGEASCIAGDDSTEAKHVDKSTNAAEEEDHSSGTAGETDSFRNSASPSPYTIPPWSELPDRPFYLEVLKDGAIVDKLPVSAKGAYMFGRIYLCDFVLEHPTISRYHAVLQYRKSSEAFLYDLGSTHGTFINKKQVKKKVYTDVHVGDIIRFGQSSRLYIFQGPLELMPPQGDLDKIRRKKLQEEIHDCEASLQRAKVEASLADGISWGMTEDAVEDMTENDDDEIKWQTFKGQLTERQEKTRGKVIKRIEKVANMRKEIDAIRSKDIAQGGLTQGQQTQIARNEQRMQQIMEELESLEETLNESIQESVGARRKTIHAKKKGSLPDEDDLLSDDDEFYDRTKKKPSLRQANEKQSVQSVETADTLLDKKYAIVKELEERTKLLQKEKTKVTSDRRTSGEDGDALDAYMTDLSSELVIDACTKIQEEISALQSELDRILYLLKIADPTGEAAQKRDAKTFPLEPGDQNNLASDVSKKNTCKEKRAATSEKAAKSSLSVHINNTTLAEQKETSEKAPTTAADREKDAPEKEPETMVYKVVKPQWLGAVRGAELTENHIDEAATQVQGSDQFIDYKDRKKALTSASKKHSNDNAASGLIIRKRKDRDEPEAASRLLDRELASTSSEVETRAEDSVALLLKHKRGYFAAENELRNETLPSTDGDQTQKNSQMKRVLGPEKPDYLCNQDYESWIPPEGQSGDGRTSLNEKLGY